MSIKLKALGPVRHGTAPKNQKLTAGPGGFVADPPAEVKDLDIGDTFEVETEAQAIDLIVSGAAEATSKSELKSLIEKVTDDRRKALRSGRRVTTEVPAALALGLLEDDESEGSVIADADNVPPGDVPTAAPAISQMGLLHAQLKKRLAGDDDDAIVRDDIEERRRRTTFEESEGGKKGGRKSGGEPKGDPDKK